MRIGWAGWLVLLAGWPLGSGLAWAQSGDRSQGGAPVVDAGTPAATPAVTAAPAGAGLAEVQYEREWAQQVVPFYRIVVRANGLGEFATSRAAQAAGGSTGAGVPIQVSQRTWGKIIGAEATIRSGRCDTGGKHMAQTGQKVMTVVDGGSTATCAFNYAGDKRLEDAVTAFAAIATTMEEGPVLEHLRRYDRLGLDAELGNFLASARDGRAIELGNLAPLLRELASDEVLMERVRSRAVTLLQMGESGS